MNPRVLFILKFRDDYSIYSYGGGLSSGLLNSAKFVVDMLAEKHIQVKLIQVIDNNDIDREVHQYQPTHVIIEALWVVPEMFDILQRLHPNVQWIIRGHSEIPFVANEGIAIDWLTRYVEFENVSIAANSEESLGDLRAIIAAANPDWDEEQVEDKVLFMPNYYPYHRHKHYDLKPADDTLDIACFGAIRPLKNQLIQAVAAIKFAQSTGQHLRFHINSTRNEQGGLNVLRNLRALFAATNYDLIEHDWMPHPNFVQLLTQMDLLMQVSFTETFNIVAADATKIGLPIVVSPEVTWASGLSSTEATDSNAIAQTIDLVTSWWAKALISSLNFWGLKRYAERSRDIWLDYLLGD